jgi:hypothetical protein
MRTDALLNFIAPGAPLSMVAGAGVNIASGVLDLAGVGVGVAPPNIIGQATYFGAPDAMGVGMLRPELVVAVGTALTTSTGATLNAALQGAADTGASGGYQPGTWYTSEETGPLTTAELTAGTFIMRFPWVPPSLVTLRPRFLRLLFQIPAGDSFTAGTIGWATVTTVRDDQFNKYAAGNYAVH